MTPPVIDLARQERMTKAHILAVDDQRPNVVLLQQILRGAGYTEITSTTDPRDVLTLYDERRPDLVLLDLLMPHVDGFTLIDRLRERMPADEYVPILVLTADVSPESRDRALSLGAQDFLTKPFDRREVLLRIRNLLETRMLHLEIREKSELLERRVEERTKELRDSLTQLRRVDEERVRLVQHLVRAQEEERQRIAADIHDDTLQVMTAVGMRLDLLQRRARDEGVSRIADGLAQTVNRAIARLRTLMFELRPPVLDREGLSAALWQHLEHVREEFGLRYRLSYRTGEDPPSESAVILYRIAQEALSNVRKHARASLVEVSLDPHAGGFLLRVEDDGVGFDPGRTVESPKGHLGLTSMRERAELTGGWCHVERRAEGGTRVQVWVPAESQLVEAGTSRT